MKKPLFFAMLAMAVALTCCGTVIAKTSQGLHETKTTASGSVDTWKFDGVTFVTTIEIRSDGLINWERGFVCAQKDQMWESAIGYEMADYLARFEVQSSTMVGNTIFYTTREGSYAYPVRCNGVSDPPSDLLAFPPAK